MTRSLAGVSSLLFGTKPRNSALTYLSILLTPDEGWDSFTRRCIPTRITETRDFILMEEKRVDAIRRDWQIN